MRSKIEKYGLFQLVHANSECLLERKLLGESTRQMIRIEATVKVNVVDVVNQAAGVLSPKEREPSSHNPSHLQGAAYGTLYQILLNEWAMAYPRPSSRGDKPTQYIPPSSMKYEATTA